MGDSSRKKSNGLKFLCLQKLIFKFLMLGDIPNNTLHPGYITIFIRVILCICRHPYITAIISLQESFVAIDSASTLLKFLKKFAPFIRVSIKVCYPLTNEFLRFVTQYSLDGIRYHYELTIFICAVEDIWYVIQDSADFSL